MQSTTTDDLTIPTFLLRKAWSKSQHKAHAAALARHPVTHLGTATKAFDPDRKERDRIALAVEPALRRLPHVEQEIKAREVLPLFALPLDELRLMLDERMPGVLKDDDEEGEGRLRGAERERVAQDVVAAVGNAEPTVHELRKLLPDMDLKTMRSGLRRALALNILFQRKDGGRYVYSTASGRKAMKQAEQIPPGQAAAKVERQPRVPRVAGKAAPGSKAALVGSLLLRPEGCTTADVLAATGWPSVSMPASAKVAGLTLRKEKVAGQPTRYWGMKNG